MARRLAVTLIFFGLSGVAAVSRAQIQPGATQSPATVNSGQAANSQGPNSQGPNSQVPTSTSASNPKAGETNSQSDKHPSDRRGGRDGGGRDGGGREGERKEGGGREGDRRFGARSLMEAVRRDGGPLELAPILLSKSALRELELSESVKTDVENFFQGLQKKWEEEHKANEENPTAASRQLSMAERVAAVSESFNQQFQKLSPDERDRVLGAFVQWRKYRSLSNRMVAVEKLGMTNDQASELRRTIDTIRDEVLNESRDKFRQLWESGRDRSEADLLMHKNREKIDERIKAKLTSEQIEKLDKLRGKPISEETLKSLDVPPPPRPRQ